MILLPPKVHGWASGKMLKNWKNVQDKSENHPYLYNTNSEFSKNKTKKKLAPFRTIFLKGRFQGGGVYLGVKVLGAFNFERKMARLAIKYM